MADVNGLTSSCRQNEFTNQYIQNYDLSYSNMGSNDIYFMYELLQYHYNSLSDMILQDSVPSIIIFNQLLTSNLYLYYYFLLHFKINARLVFYIHK
ncbi:death-associated inhibitor of apoptosis 1-like [Aphis craccivora]|uniref:Death-associated inhibitor of apoptosis 1-like n=1 Tax=Aphis craccivora TaxID=307492 RepID=A0A6G0VQ66_APHCR|nr:death-associated inhibitor of apoptosis 1-like [Aphis craccivora]